MPDAIDLLILGSGSTAFAAALAAQEMGKTAVMTEERPIGGTCVNRGCLPSKNLIEAAKIVHDAAHPRYPGLQSCRVAIDFAALIDQKNEIVHNYRRKKYESLVAGRITVEKGHVRFIDPHTVQVGEKRIRGDKLLIATGSRPLLPDIDGLDRVPYLTSDLLTVDEPTELRELPKSLLIVGGGYIALELGQMFHRFGTQITLLERSEQLLKHGYEPELGPSIAKVLAAEGIQIVTRASPRSVTRHDQNITLTVTVAGREQQYRAEKLLIATGRRPNTDDIAIERAGVKRNARGEIEVDEHLRTNVPHIFAAGDVIGRQTDGQMATPVGSQDGGVAAHNALAGKELRTVNHRVIPRTIFTDPQVATVGMTEAQATTAGHRCWCNTLPMSLVPRAGAIRDTKGLIKMVADADTGEVLGISMIGHNAGEVIHEAAMALQFRAKLHDFIELLHVYPTMAEALKIAAISKFKDPEKLRAAQNEHRARGLAAREPIGVRRLSTDPEIVSHDLRFGAGRRSTAAGGSDLTVDLFRFITGILERIPPLRAKKRDEMRRLAKRLGVGKIPENQWFSELFGGFPERSDKDEVRSSNLLGPI